MSAKVVSANAMKANVVSAHSQEALFDMARAYGMPF
jgi:hypothetical protein